MSEALFALGGAVLGVLSTILTELVRSRSQDRSSWRRELRSVCVAFAEEISRLRDLSYELSRMPHEPRLQAAATDAHMRARGLMERLRLTSDSPATQKAARWLIHCAYHQWQVTQGGPGDFATARAGLDDWLERMLVEARKELGLAGDRIFAEPRQGLPIPGAGDRDVPNPGVEQP
jgi:hypothetical protein